MANLSLKSIKKKYGNTEAVTDFNLDITDGEFVVLVGPSGCGKSTTLRMIAGLESITEGELHIDGLLMNNVLPKDRDIAMVFQSYALYPHLSVYDNLAFPLSSRRVPKKEIRKKVEETAALLELTPLLKRKPKELSGGQKQRVAVGRAMVRSPKVFLFDEPLSNLDAKLRAQMRVNISKLHNDLKTTFVYVTHDQIEAMTMGTRIVVMKDGRIQQADIPQRVYDKPVNMFVAGFIGTPQMNFLDVELKDRPGKGICAVFGRYELPLPENMIKAAGIITHVGKPVVMGIRPESLYHSAYQRDNMKDSELEAGCEVVEHMGSQTYLHLLCEGQHITAQVEPYLELSAGDMVEIAADMKKCHFFDKDTEESLLYGETTTTKEPAAYAYAQ